MQFALRERLTVRRECSSKRKLAVAAVTGPDGSNPERSSGGGRYFEMKGKGNLRFHFRGASPPLLRGVLPLKMK